VIYATYPRKTRTRELQEFRRKAQIALNAKDRYNLAKAIELDRLTQVASPAKAM